MYGIDSERNQLGIDLANEDDLGAVVRGHIRIESLQVRFIEAKLPNSRHLKDIRFGFYERTALALSLGLREELKGPLRALGKIRNSFAHHPNMNLSEEMEIEFMSSFEKKDRTIFEESIQKIAVETNTDTTKFSHKDRFRLAISTLWAACRVETMWAEDKTQR